MAIAAVASAKVQGASGGTTGSIDTTGATLLVVSVSYAKGGARTISDNKSNTWTQLTAKGDGSFMDETFYYAANPTVGTGHTFTVGGGALNQSLTVAAFSGVIASSPFDKQNGFGTGSTVSSIQPGSSGTPTGSASSLIVCGLGTVWTSSVTIDSSFTILQQNPFVGGTAYGNAIAWKESTTAENPTYTATSGTSIATAAVIAVFKPTTAVDANVNLSGVSGTAAAGTLTAAGDASFTLSGVSGTAGAGTLGIQTAGASDLVGISAAAAAGSFSLAVDSTVSLSGVSATAAVGTLTADASVTFALDGVDATAYAGDLSPVTNFLTVPMITIMNANPIPVDGGMVSDDVAMEGDLPYQLAFEGVINTNPIPMAGAMSAVPVPGEGSVP